MKAFFIATLLLASFVTAAQDLFESKKEEKLYYKLDDAYLDYDYETILDNEENAKEAFLSTEDTLAANVYSMLAEAYDYEVGNFQQALDYYNLELALREKLEPEEDNKDLLFNIATLQSELGYFGQAEEVLSHIQKQDLDTYGRDSEEYFDTSMALAELYLTVDKAENARKVLENVKASELSPEYRIGYFKSLGDTYAIQGNFRKAEKILQKSVTVALENGIESSFEYLSTLNSLGALYLDNGKIPEAADIYVSALEIADKMQETEDLNAILKEGLAQAYNLLGNNAEAVSLLEEAQETIIDYYGEDSFNTGIGYLNLGITYFKNKNYTKAEDAYNQARDIFSSDGEGQASLYVGRAESRMSELYIQLGQIEKAKGLATRAIDTYAATLGEGHWESTWPRSFLAKVYTIEADLVNAELQAQKVLKVRKKQLGENHPQYAKATLQLAFIYWKKGDTREALKYYQQTFKNYFQQINTFFPVLTEEEKATFYYTQLRPAFEQYVSFIAETSREDKALLGEIYDYQLALKGLIMYATSKVREGILASGDETLIADFEEWIGQKEQLAKLFSATDMDLEVRNQRIDSLTKTSNELEESLSKASQSFGDNFANKSATWQDIKKTLEPGEAAVEMVRYKVFTTDSAGLFTQEVHYAAMVVRHDTEDHPEMVILRNGAQMEKKYLANYRNAIKYKVAENYSYRLFWLPIARKLEGISKLYFAPDGVYNQISIYTLQNPKTKDYLLNEIDLALVTNTKDLLVENTSYQPDGRSVFFGYPQYSLGADAMEQDADDRGVRGVRGADRGLRSGAGGELTRGASIPRGVRGNLVRYMQSFNGLGMLPGTKKEVELIDELYEANGRVRETYYLNNALESTVKSVDNPNILHIATHGFFLEQDPDEQTNDSYVQNPLLRSGLILAGANNFIQTGSITSEQNGDDGILTAFEAMNMKLDDTDVVVLSACETGLGEIKNGEGVYGLQRSFQIAGADAIIMSMWTVDDDATQELMTTFYAEWLSHGNKQLAFNTAQKVLREKYEKPYYWGAFVMIGE